MKVYQSSGLLNQNAFFFGLDRSDLVGLSLVLITTQKLGLEALHKGLPMAITLAVAAALVPIRLRYKRKTIRGFIKIGGSHVARWILTR